MARAMKRRQRLADGFLGHRCRVVKFRLLVRHDTLYCRWRAFRREVPPRFSLFGHDIERCV